jgi:hypothetical protein
MVGLSAWSAKSQAIKSLPDTVAEIGGIRLRCVRVDVFTAVTMKNVVFWDVAPCRYCDVYC